MDGGRCIPIESDAHSFAHTSRSYTSLTIDIARVESQAHNLERSCHDYFVALVWANYHISSLLADAWEHFARYPMLEAFGAVEFGREDEGIEAGFVDVNHALNSACCRGVTFRDILCFYMFS